MDANCSRIVNPVLTLAQEVISPPPKTYFDTQIVIDAANGKIPPHDWETATRYLRTVSRYCVSALTIMELLWALARSEDRYFEIHKRRLRTLLEPDQEPEVFDFIRYFAAKELGLTLARRLHLEDDFVKYD